MTTLKDFVWNHRSVVGIDGCKNGWVAVYLDETTYDIQIYSSIDELCKAYSSSARLFIDIPIGLPSTVFESEQRPESSARKLLGKRSSTVFNVPCKKSVYAETYLEANVLNREILGKGLTKQSYYISNKIREVDVFLRANHEYKNKLQEAHPEICFTMLQQECEPIIEPKRTESGFIKRMNLLKQLDQRVVNIYKDIKSQQVFHRIQDDIVDALCLAITAKLSLYYPLQSIPKTPQRNEDALLMQMVFVRSWVSLATLS